MLIIYIDCIYTFETFFSGWRSVSLRHILTVAHLSIWQVILSGDGVDECSIPGGFGAAGAPNDGWHQHVHALVHSYCKTAVEWSDSLDLRRELDKLQLSVQSSVTTKFHRYAESVYSWYPYTYIYIIYMCSFGFHYLHNIGKNKELLYKGLHNNVHSQGPRCWHLFEAMHMHWNRWIPLSGFPKTNWRKE